MLDLLAKAAQPRRGAVTLNMRDHAAVAKASTDKVICLRHPKRGGLPLWLAGRVASVLASRVAVCSGWVA